MITIPGVEASPLVIERLKKLNGGVHSLAFSCGKDAILALLATRDHLDLHLHYQYVVPDLEFVEESLSYYEKRFSVKINRIPHPSLYRMLAAGVFQPPERIPHINAAGLQAFDYEDLRAALYDTLGIGDAWDLVGVRANDSIMRRLHFTKHGAMNHKRRVAYPVWDYSIDDLLTALKLHDVKLPVDYALFGRSFDGINYKYLPQIKHHFPADYQRILAWFPLAEIEVFRYEKAYGPYRPN